VAVAAIVVAGNSGDTTTPVVPDHEPPSPTTTGSGAAEGSLGPGETEAAAGAEARRTASHQLASFGIYFTPRELSASCGQVSTGRWICTVKSTPTKQCSGTVEIFFSGHEYLRAYGEHPRMGCLE
jgi:hypothetical protein